MQDKAAFLPVTKDNVYLYPKTKHGKKNRFQSLRKISLV